MTGSRRVVFACCDGLGRNRVRADTTPVLHGLARTSLWCAEHSAVFPSVTRVSAASVTTGGHPARHGLHGNRMGLLEKGRIVVRDVGSPDFRQHMRRATGGTLLVPALAERLGGNGGCIAFSNVSPGAAYFLDPEHLGHIYHTLHGVPLGSPAHADALRGAERCVAEVVRTVERLRGEGDEILLLIGSDHGRETIGEGVAIEEWLSANGLEELLATGDVAVAGQGTAALLSTDRLCLVVEAGHSDMEKIPSSRQEPRLARRSGGTFLGAASSKKGPSTAPPMAL